MPPVQVSTCVGDLAALSLRTGGYARVITLRTDVEYSTLNNNDHISVLYEQDEGTSVSIAIIADNPVLTHEPIRNGLTYDPCKGVVRCFSATCPVLPFVQILVTQTHNLFLFQILY